MKSHTDLKQSKKLAKILPADSADGHYVRKVTDFMGNPVDGEWSYPKYGNVNSKYAHYVVQNFESYEVIPCWSLAALLNYLREIDFFPEIDADKFTVTMNINYYNGEDESLLVPIYNINAKAKSLIDVCVEMIFMLKEKDLL